MKSIVIPTYYEVERMPFLHEVICGSFYLNPTQLERGVIQWADDNNVAPFLACKLSEHDAGDAILLDWAKGYRAECVKRSQSVLEELRAIYREFDIEGVTGVVVVENFGTLIATDGDLGNFGSGDVDLMGPRAEAGRISVCVERAGWRRTVRRGVGNHIMTTFEKEINGGSFYLNIEWKFVSRRFFFRQSQLEKRMEKWRSEGYVQRSAGIDVLAPEANFYLNCMHISIGHYYGVNPGLRLYKDIEPYLSGSQNISLDIPLIWAEEDGTRLRLETCLALYTTIYDHKEELPVAISSCATQLAERVQSILATRQTQYFSRFQEVRIDQLSEGMSLPAYLAQRVMHSFVKV